MTIKATDLVINALQSVGDDLILVDVIPVNEWKNGVKTENIIGFKYVAAVKKLGLEKLSVKIEGPKLLEATDDLPLVVFEDLDITLFWGSGGTIQVSAKAKGITLKNKNPKASSVN